MIRRITQGMRWLLQPVVAQWPLFVLCWLAMALQGMLDLWRLADFEFLTTAYALGLLHIVVRNVCFSAVVAWAASLVATVARRRWVCWLLALAAMVVLAVGIFVRYHYGTRLTPEIATVIVETNRGEATEYLQTYVLSRAGLLLVGVFVVAIGAYAWAGARCRRQAHHLSRWGTAVAWLVIPLVLGEAVWTVVTWPGKHAPVSRYENFGVDAVTNVLLCRQAMAQVDGQVAQAVAATAQVYSQPSVPLQGDSLVLVLVIGESYIKAHAGIYGYPLPTTPRQQAECDAGRLVVMRDMVAPYHYTNMALRSMLSTGSEGLGQQWCDSPLVMAIFKHAGYHVDMWDNQREFLHDTRETRGLNGLLYHRQVMTLCYDCVNDRNFEFDGELVSDYARQRRDAAHQLVVLHLRGQHIRAERRYPHTARWQRFSAQDYAYRHEPFVDADAIDKIAHYDNATRYNDAVLGQVFDLFAHRQAVVVCVSDHGDEVYDYRDSQGRRDDRQHPELMVRYQHEVPMVVWCSPAFMTAHADVVSRLRRAASRPGTTDNLSQLLLGLGGITSPYYHPGLDILSDDYRPPRRIVRKTYDYDRLLQQGQ